jgi:dienelactone hydrolase
MASGTIIQAARFTENKQISEPAIPANRPQWADGTFNGTLYQANEPTGTVTGFIQLGRNSQRGWFTGVWDTGDMQGQAAGFFFGPLLFGQLNASSSRLSIPLVGILQSNASWFSIRIISPPGQDMHVSGSRRVSFLPEPDGPYEIGTTAMHLVDDEREEQFTDDPSDARELMLQFWYPIEDAGDDQAAYMDPETFDWLKHESPIPLFWIPDNAYNDVMPHAVKNALPPSGQTFPVLLFSHGYDGVREIYTSLIEDLVSHGYVVAAVQHPYVAGVTVFPDGRVVQHMDPPSDQEGAEAYFRTAFETVVGDLEFVLDILEGMALPLRACFNLDRIGIYGHSFGGGASAALCNQDERVLAGAALDGFFQGDAAENGSEKPFLWLLAEGHLERDTMLQQMWNQTISDAYMATVAGAAHYSYTDVGLLLKHFAPLIPRQAVGFGSIEPKRLIDIANAYILAFFDSYLKERPIEDLLDLAEKYPEVSFDYK